MSMPNSSQLWRTLSSRKGLFLFAGPCVIESEELCLAIARSLKRTCAALRIPLVFKASFDKANRSSGQAFRGPGLSDGLAILARIRQRVGVPIMTDVHTEDQAVAAGEVCDVLQIPAFLCRQTDLILAAMGTGKIVNIKKGQFLAPEDMGNVVKKAVAVGGKRILLCERGTTFGYHTLVNDFRGLPTMAKLGFPIVFDATHSVQQPGGLGDRTGGQREFVPLLARCAVVAGANGLFIETHPEPGRALSDGPNLVPLAEMRHLLKELLQLKRVVAAWK